MTQYISVVFPIKNRLPALLIKVKACGKQNRSRARASFVAYHILRTCQVQQFPPHLSLPIGLEKPRERAKGINHPKYSVEAEYAYLTRESATT